MRRTRWSCERAREWSERQGWRIGCNFVPSTAVNQLEMWQADTFDPETVEQELAWAADIGMTAIRVYLHDLAWQSDSEGLKRRMDRFLSIADTRGIATAFVLFDDCWYPNARPGSQPDPVPGKHNSRWRQSPGISVARDPAEKPRLKAYVQDVCSTFGRDSRVLFWDVYNEVGNFFLPDLSEPRRRRIIPLAVGMLRFYLAPLPTLALARQAFEWIRAVEPDQPLTAAVWYTHPRLNRVLASISDIVSFHNYESSTRLERQIGRLTRHDRPLICTEYLARTAGSTFQDCLPVFFRHQVSCFNWGLVSGRTQTWYTWHDHDNLDEPRIWFHDIFRTDGSPYDQSEIALLRSYRDSGVER
jgi:hypothetical protein